MLGTSASKMACAAWVGLRTRSSRADHFRRTIATWFDNYSDISYIAALYATLANTTGNEPIILTGRDGALLNVAFRAATNFSFPPRTEFRKVGWPDSNSGAPPLFGGMPVKRHPIHPGRHAVELHPGADPVGH
jgi:hypothetical protein